MAENDVYVVKFNGTIYNLNKAQYKSFLRKKDLPADRLILWLNSYNEENNYDI